MQKPIYLCYLPLTVSLQEQYCLDDLAARGVPLEYWDVTAAFFASLRLSGQIERPYVRKFKSLDELRERLAAEDLSNVLLVSLISFEPRALNFFRILSRSGARTAAYATGLHPVPAGGLGAKLAANLSYLADPGRLKEFIKNRAALMLRRWLVRDPDVLYAAGGAASGAYPSARELKINYFDYDDVLAHEGEARLVEGRYGVFLDDNLPHHPDVGMFGAEPIDPAPYYAALEKFFERLEKKFGLEMVIAAHPKSDYREGAFGGRKLFRGATRRLAAHAEFAVTTASTSISYPVLYRKPIFFVHTDEVERKYAPIKLVLFSKLFAETLGCPSFNLDRAPAVDALPVVDPAKYDRYKYNYLVSRESEGRSTRDILWDYYKS